MKVLLSLSSLALTIFLNATASLLLKLSTGLPTRTKLVVAAGSLSCFALAFISYYLCLRRFPVSVVYPVITGGGILTIVLAAAPMLGEPLTHSKAFGAILVVFGGVLLLQQS